MDSLIRFFFIYILVNVFLIFRTVNSETYSVKVSTDKHINVVDSRFLSFTIDPEYLFTSNEKYNNKECVCMASALTPAFIRIAGPSTSHLTFKNTSITITQDLDHDQVYATNKPPLFRKLSVILSPETERSQVKRSNQLSVTDNQWRKFVQWSNQTGFDIVFGLNNQEKLSSGVWDANTALSILSVADQDGLENIVWQLGYECRNQSIDDYLYDLETLKVMVETFPRGSSGHWKVVAGDVSPCLQVDSKNDFKDFVTLSNDRLDAILMEGKSATKELDRMTRKDRLKLQNILSTSETPLWITEGQRPEDLRDNAEEFRAADWMNSLGQSARNGFAVHYRELKEDDLFQPSLSFYMALLYKNLVGERVLNAEFDTPSEKASLFAHCTSLRHKSVPGAVTLFGANMDDETARFSLKLSKREHGGDIMQFILGLDASGNIMVNGRPMYYEGDIRPIVKRVLPYRTLLISLPPKTFGFWVLADTNIGACIDKKHNDDENKFAETVTVDDDKFEDHNLIRTKRSNYIDVDYPDFVDFYTKQLVLDAKKETSMLTDREALNKRVRKINNDLKNMLRREERTSDNHIDITDEFSKSDRIKRQIDDSFQEEKLHNKLRRPLIQRKPFIFKSKDNKVFESVAKNDDFKPKERFLLKIKLLNAKLNETKQLRSERARKMGFNLPLVKNKVTKRNSDKIFHKKSETKFQEHKKDHEELEQNKLDRNIDKQQNNITRDKIVPNRDQTLKSLNKSRKRRSILDDNKGKSIEVSMENEIDTDGAEFKKFGKILHKINKQLQELPGKLGESKNINEDSGAIEDEVSLKTKITNDDASIKLSEKSNYGILKVTFNKAISVLDNLNSKLNRLTSAITF